MGEQPAIEAVRIASLVKRYGPVCALSNVSLEVAAGEAFGLVGANGAGKTTLIRCMLDLAAGDAGSVAIFGVPARRPQARRRLAYVPERFVPPHYLRGREFMSSLAQLAGSGYDAARARALRAELELDAALLRRPARQGSNGVTQELGRAAAPLLGPALFLLDPPVSRRGPA